MILDARSYADPRIHQEVQSIVGLSNSIREHRFKYGEMTQKELAEKVGVSRQTMNAIENNKHAPTIDVAIRIADVFREAVDTVFEYEYDGRPEFLVVCVSFAGDPEQIEAGCKDLAASLPSEAL